VSDTKGFNVGDWVDVVNTTSGASDSYIAGFVTAVTAGSSITVTPTFIYAGSQTTSSSWQIDQAVEPSFSTTSQVGSTLSSLATPYSTGATSSAVFYPLVPSSTSNTGSTFTNVDTYIHNTLSETVTATVGTAPAGGPTGNNDYLYVEQLSPSGTATIVATVTINKAFTSASASFTPVPGDSYAIQLQRSSGAGNTTWQWTWSAPTPPTQPGISGLS